MRFVTLARFWFPVQPDVTIIMSVSFAVEMISANLDLLHPKLQQDVESHNLDCDVRLSIRYRKMGLRFSCIPETCLLSSDFCKLLSITWQCLHLCPIPWLKQRARPRLLTESMADVFTDYPHRVAFLTFNFLLSSLSQKVRQHNKKVSSFPNRATSCVQPLTRLDCHSMIQNLLLLLLYDRQIYIPRNFYRAVSKKNTSCTCAFI